MAVKAHVASKLGRRAQLKTRTLPLSSLSVVPIST
ncbi:hypothetical protein FQN60_002010 [Etheostoma spectabile]|uniref:Uncharacterized protein n=1 Tax=Etheostoma spectabile TaxID=54343 RepID=A0A5J5DA52_9PERO|nr:hypothetical protein FQN60_002010 [Etheostoma spectabile]